MALIKYVSAVRYAELMTKGAHKTKYADYEWRADEKGRYLLETDLHGTQSKIKQRPKGKEWRYDPNWMKELWSQGHGAERTEGENA